MADRITKWLWQKLFPDSNSIVDTLKASGQDSSFEARSKLAAQAGIQNYSWTADQNLKLLATLKNKNNTTGTDNGTSSINANVANTTNLSTGQTVDDTTLAVSQDKATYWVDPAVDNLIASQYKNAEDKKYETYVDKIGMETGIYADIQNIDTQVLETYKILWMSDQDIFSRQDITAEEKIAMSNQRKNIATNKINQLRKLQQAKQNEIKELADFEAKKAEAQQAAYKEALDYMKQVNEQNQYNLDVAKFNLDVSKAQSWIDLDLKKFEQWQVEFNVKQSLYWDSSYWSSSILDFISSAEWTNWNYNAWYSNWAQSDVDLSQYTVSQIMQLQDQLINQTWGSAIWKYQFLKSTLQDMINRWLINKDEKFTPSFQDRIATTKLKERWLDDYINWNITESEFQKRLSQEWASLPSDSSWKSYYEWDWVNKALVWSNELLNCFWLSK